MNQKNIITLLAAAAATFLVIRMLTTPKTSPQATEKPASGGWIDTIGLKSPGSPLVGDARAVDIGLSTVADGTYYDSYQSVLPLLTTWE